MSDESRARVNAGIPKTGLTFWAPGVDMVRDPAGEGRKSAMEKMFF